MSLDFTTCHIVMQKNQRRGKMADTAAQNVLDVLRYLRMVFWQDIPYYYKEYADLPIFSSTLFHVHWTAFKRWCEIVWAVNKEMISISEQAGGPPEVFLRSDEKISEVFLQMHIVSNSFTVPNGYKTIPVQGSKFFSYLEKVRCDSLNGSQSEICHFCVNYFYIHSL